MMRNTQHQALRRFKPGTALAALLLFVLCTVPAQGQTPPQSAPINRTPSVQKQTFEVASIRIEDPKGPPVRFDNSGPNEFTTFPTNRLTNRHIMLKSLISAAYGLDYNRITGGPDWLDHEHYDIVAKVEGDALLTKKQMEPMLQNLLEDRFNLRVHREHKIVPGYALVLAKGGPKLGAHKGAPGGWLYGRDEIKAVDTSVESIGKLIAEVVKQPVIDKTGLTGMYDFDLRFAPDNGTGSAPDSQYADIFTALQKELGLKLVPQKVTIDTLVIDHVDRSPTQN